ncbi:mCG145502, partial [Mus musculus]
AKLKISPVHPDPIKWKISSVLIYDFHSVMVKVQIPASIGNSPFQAICPHHQDSVSDILTGDKLFLKDPWTIQICRCSSLYTNIFSCTCPQPPAFFKACPSFHPQLHEATNAESVTMRPSCVILFFRVMFSMDTNTFGTVMETQGFFN